MALLYDVSGNPSTDAFETPPPAGAFSETLGTTLPKMPGASGRTAFLEGPRSLEEACQVLYGNEKHQELLRDVPQKHLRGEVSP